LSVQGADKRKFVLTLDDTPEEVADTIVERSVDDIISSLPALAYPNGYLRITSSPLVYYDLQYTDTISPLADLPKPTLGRINRRNVSDIYKEPTWITEGGMMEKSRDLLRQMEMTGRRHNIDFFMWDLPKPPKAVSFNSNITVDANRFISGPGRGLNNVGELKKKHWLHTASADIQFSQAYISPNWYQGGDNNLALIIKLLWNVKLNQVYHPNLLFESNLKYNLGLYSTPQDLYHEYSVSEDIFQWNLTGGVKAFEKWFYSFTMQFKTQLLNNYGQNSLERKAAFMSPGDLNVGLGMTYSTTNKSKSLKFQASIAPFSYNLRTCLDTKVDPTQFSITEGHKTSNEIGSNAELTLEWKLSSNISYKSRLFLFSNYKYFNGDWENTVSFSINRFLSTQIYVHARYDTSTEITNNKWKHWMLKEILSFGFSYTFNTVPTASK
jgi:hypothetical protein